MDRITRVLAGLLGRSAGLLPAARRDWAEAVLAARTYADLAALTVDLY